MLQLKLALLIVLLALAVNARIQVPFSAYKYDDYVTIALNISVGTPEKEFLVELSTETTFFATNLYIVGSKTFQDGGFDPAKSSSFLSVNDIPRVGGTDLNGTETVKIGGKTLTTKPIELVYTKKSHFSTKGGIGFKRYVAANEYNKCLNGPENCTTFVQSLLREQKEKIVVLVFDKVPGDLNPDDAKFNGQIIFGERPNDLCEKDWTFAAEDPELVQYDTQWFFNVSSVSVGKYSWKSSAARIYIDLTETNITIPTKVYNALIKANGGIGDILPCDSNVDLVFNIGGKDFNIKPEMYLKKNEDGTCAFAGVATSYEPFTYELPSSVFSERCLAYNFEKLGIEIAERVKH